MVTHELADSRCDAVWCSMSATASRAACASRAPAKQPRHVARLGAPVMVLGAQKRLDQPQIGPPPFHRGAEIVHRDRLDPLPVLDRAASLGQDVPGAGTQRFPDRLMRTQTRLVTHATVLLWGFVTIYDLEPLRPFHSGRCLLHSGHRAPEVPAARVSAGWSSPVARQAHNLKVAGSNPAPATKFTRQIRCLCAGCRVFSCVAGDPLNSPARDIRRRSRSRWDCEPGAWLRSGFGRRGRGGGRAARGTP